MEENQSQSTEAENTNEAPAEAQTLLTDTTEVSTGDEKTNESPAEENPVEKKEEGAPEKYEFKPQDGLTIDGNVMESFSMVAKKLNLSQEKAQSMLDEMAPAIAKRQQAQIDEVHKQWTEQSKADPEFGGDKLAENLGIANKAFEKYATPELKQMLNDTGLGNNPEIVRMFYRVGKTISEDTFVDGSGASGEASYQEILYGKKDGK